MDLKKKTDDDFIRSDTTQNIEQNFSQMESRSTESPSGFAIAGLVCGILSIICCCAWYISGILGILGLVFSIMVLTKNLPGRSLAIAGVICAGIGVVLAVVMLVFVFGVSNAFSSMSPEELRELIRSLEELD